MEMGIPLVVAVADLLSLLPKSTFSHSVMRTFFREFIVIGSGDEGDEAVDNSGVGLGLSLETFGSKDRTFLVLLSISKSVSEGFRKGVCVWCCTVAAATTAATAAAEGVSLGGVGGVVEVAGGGRGGGEVLGPTMTDCRISRVGVEVEVVGVTEKCNGEQAEVELTTGGEVGGVVLQEKHCEGLRMCNCSSIFACLLSRFRAMRSFISAFSSSLRIHS